ncbi:SCO family protein [Pseudoxanthomonas koreensis]|uniref:SCO family protein n=1 Tax=Pseudoxanthomonas koreensis TaxID=266061 RepID=UPI0013916EAB|nr:SCO family protein [Pseudoxanthomonas koreensis]KAF1693129.1 SCO family protein [Pseudoxanthomonas koreensis]
MKLPLNPLLLAIALATGTLAFHATAAPATTSAAATANALPGDSLYHLQAGLTDQHGKPLQWSDLRGQPQLVSMFYGNCHLMCPLILENAKALQKQLPEAERGRLGVAMLTLDPARDTPAAMAEVAERHRTPEDWRYLVPAADDVRALASVLDVRYRFREDGSINHTSVLVLLDAEGRPLARSEVDGAAPDPAFLQQVRDALATP